MHIIKDDSIISCTKLDFIDQYDKAPDYDFQVIV